jgi:hypothetical protein
VCALLSLQAAADGELAPQRQMSSRQADTEDERGAAVLHHCVQH